MRRRLRILFLFVGPLSLFGCGVLIAGTAATGVGVYTYVNGDLTRSYQATFDQTTRATIQTLNDLNISITEKSSDGIDTFIRGKRRDGTVVTVEVATLAQNITEVSVRSGVVGVWDKQFSERIHDNIAQRL